MDLCAREQERRRLSRGLREHDLRPPLVRHDRPVEGLLVAPPGFRILPQSVTKLRPGLEEGLVALLGFRAGVEHRLTAARALGILKHILDAGESLGLRTGTEKFQRPRHRLVERPPVRAVVAGRRPEIDQRLPGRDDARVPREQVDRPRR